MRRLVPYVLARCRTGPPTAALRTRSRSRLAPAPATRTCSTRTDPPLAPAPTLTPTPTPGSSSVSEFTVAPDSATRLTELQAWHELTGGELGLLDYPVKAVEMMLEAAHVFGGLSWVSVFMLAPVVVRFALLPLYFRTMRNGYVMQKLQPQVKEYQLKQQRLVQLGKESPATLMAGMQELYKAHGASVFTGPKNALVQAPFFVGMYLAIRDMSTLSPAWMARLQNAGVLWFPDLTVPDPTFILPVLSGISFWAVMMRVSGTTPGLFVVWIARLMPLVITVVTSYFSSAVALYWASSGTFILLSALSLWINPIRRLAGIPPIVSATPVPPPPPPAASNSASTATPVTPSLNSNLSKEDNRRRKRRS